LRGIEANALASLESGLWGEAKGVYEVGNGE